MNALFAHEKEDERGERRECGVAGHGGVRFSHTDCGEDMGRGGGGHAGHPPSGRHLHVVQPNH